eukprot:702772-Alexandrium_andersonii.AAC.1
MSASLVGSEMCIRDRGLTLPLSHDDAGAPVPIGQAGRPPAVEPEVPERSQRNVRHRQARSVRDDS